jgi:hypothetical protein
MLTVHHFLIGFTVLVLWVLSLWVHPFEKCPRCRGRRFVMRGSKRPANRGQRARRKPIKCRVCKGIGRRQRPGSRTLHRTIRKIRRELDRQRRARQTAVSEGDDRANVH